MECQWHQLDHMHIVCTSRQTDNHASTSPLSFYRLDALPAAKPGRYLWCCHHCSEPSREFTQFIWWMRTERWVATYLHTKPNDWDCKSAENLQLPSTSTIAIYYYFQPRRSTDEQTWQADRGNFRYLLRQEYSPYGYLSSASYYSAWKLMLILLSTEGGRLSQPRHCRKGAAARAQDCVSHWLSW